MSCIAGVGGEVDPRVNTATSGRPTVVIDGCPLECANRSLAKHDVTPDAHVTLAIEGVPRSTTPTKTTNRPKNCSTNSSERSNE